MKRQTSSINAGLVRTDAYAARRLDVNLTQGQAQTLTDLFNDLHDRHIKLASGRHVDSHADAVRWLLDEIERNRKDAPAAKVAGGKK